METAYSPPISIIIPTSNSAATLQTCLNSICTQDFDDYEVLIIDGASTDNTLEIAKSYLPKIPHLKLQTEPDRGIYDAMNKGIKLAGGRYLYFLGSDDTLFSNNVLSAISKELATTQPTVVYGNVMMHGTNKWVSKEGIYAGEFDLKRILSVNICHQSIFYHKAAFDYFGVYNLKYPVLADYDFNLKLFAKYPFKYVDIVVANFNVGGASTSITDTEFEADKIKNIISYFFKKLFTRAFIDCRLYVQQAAISTKTGLSVGTRLYCLLAYTKLKIQALLI